MNNENGSAGGVVRDRMKEMKLPSNNGPECIQVELLWFFINFSSLFSECFSCCFSVLFRSTTSEYSDFLPLPFVCTDLLLFMNL